jgi:Septum formation inhibitor MinC, C-terminal domain
VIIGSVNGGAEVLADGDIHVYGQLNGRALAGLGGMKSAKIFASQFNASLVAIADVFVVPDEESSIDGFIGKPAVVGLVQAAKNAPSDTHTNTQARAQPHAHENQLPDTVPPAGGVVIDSEKDAKIVISPLTF